MKSEEKKESLIFSLFNRSKREDDSNEEQFEQEQKAINQEIEQLSKPAPAPSSDIKGEWDAVTPDLKGDVRAAHIRLWISRDKMKAKAKRLEFVPPEQPKPSEEELEREQAKINELRQKLLDEKTNEAERAAVQKELDELTVEKKPPEEPDYSQYEWDDIFVRLAITSVGIKHGVNEEAVLSLLDKIYDHEVIIAQGTPQKDGIDGAVKEFFKREAAPSFETRPDGSIDFKNMHLVTNVKKGTIIAQLVPPVQGEVGFNVLGVQLNPRSGQAKILSRGDHTDLVKDEERPEIQNLIATIDGNLVFKAGKFNVDNVYKVNGNVDNSTGNINFVGNVIIAGDVFEGYEIRTHGDITVFGMVEGASLFAGGSIHLEKGINGMMKGSMEAGAEITAKFIENCKVRAGGNVNSESIINCTIECDKSIKVTGKGLISGGKCTAFGSVECKVIGSRSSTQSTIVLGITPSIIRERNELEESYKVVCREHEEIHKNITYLEALKFTGEKELGRKKMLAKLQGTSSISNLKKQRLELRREEVQEEMRNVATCTFLCDTAYPPARITIGNANYVIKETLERCRFYRNTDGEITVGTK